MAASEIAHDDINYKPINVWWFATGYFSCYVAYAYLTKIAASSPSIAGTHINGFEAVAHGLLPGLLVGFMLVLPIVIAIVHNMVPRSQRWQPIQRAHVLAGVSTAIIVVTTTIAYSFAGVSVLLALLLMRGGVLVLSPVIDMLMARDITKYAIFALILSIGAVCLALANIKTVVITTAVMGNLACYLFAYGIRLSVMTRYAKRSQRGQRAGFFVREQIVVVSVLLLLSALLMLSDFGLAQRFQSGLISLGAESGQWARIGIGVAYGFALIFGTLIYLDASSNTFSVSLNRGVSLIAGLLVSWLLVWIEGASWPSASVLISAALVLLGLILLGLGDRRSADQRALQAPSALG